MNQCKMKLSWVTILLLAGMASWGIAQDRPASHAADKSGRGNNGFVATLEHKVGLTPEQRDAVRGLLAEQHQKSRALREETDAKIRAILNPDQQKKFDDVLAEQKTRFTRKSQGA